MKKNSLALFIYTVFGLITVLSSTVSAQNPTLQEINSDKIVLQNYMLASSLRNDQRPRFFSDLSNQDKADLMRFHLAFQFLKRPWLNDSQKNFILETISTISPQMYDGTSLNRQNDQLAQQKILSVFQKQEGAEIFASLSGDTGDVVALQKHSETTLSFYSIKRRHTFSRLSPLEKSNTMRIHLLRHLSRYDLSLEQRRFILSVLSFVTPEIYAIPQGTPERARIDAVAKSFDNQMRNFFKPREAAEIFLSLGGADGQSPENAVSFNLVNALTDSSKFVKSSCSSSSLFEVSFSKINQSTYKSTATTPLCSCNANPSQDYCGWWHNNSSCSSSQSCEYSPGGCGTALLYPCVAMCKRSTMEEML